MTHFLLSHQLTCREDILLEGGAGARMYPVTKSISKRLLPIYDRLMIYYPLPILMLTVIHEILVISTPQDIPMYEKLRRGDWALDFSMPSSANQEGLLRLYN